MRNLSTALTGRRVHGCWLIQRRIPEHHFGSGVAPGHKAAMRSRQSRRQPEIEVTMASTRDQRQIVETATEARQGEPGPSVLALLAISTGLAILILAVVWFVFFRT
jgi:hypothetical protein